MWKFPKSTMVSLNGGVKCMNGGMGLVINIPTMIDGGFHSHGGTPKNHAFKGKTLLKWMGLFDWIRIELFPIHSFPIHSFPISSMNGGWDYLRLNFSYSQFSCRCFVPQSSRDDWSIHSASFGSIYRSLIHFSPSITPIIRTRSHVWIFMVHHG